MNIAMLSYHTCPLATLGGKDTGGMNVYVRDLTRTLGPLGIHVDVFTRSQDEHVPHVLHDLGYGNRVVHVPAGPETPLPRRELAGYIPQFVDGIRRFAEEKRIHYDVIHSHYWMSGLAAASLADLWPGTPILHMFHTLGEMKNRIARSDAEREGAYRIEGEKRVLKRADRVIVATEAEKAQLQWLYKGDVRKMEIIPPGVDVSHFYPIPKDEARQFIGLEPDQRMVLFVGRIEPLKGVDTLIRAMSCVKFQGLGHPVYLAIIGGEPDADPDKMTAEMARLQQLCDDLCMGQTVVFLGKRAQDTLPYYYSAADALVMPSFYESFGMVAGGHGLRDARRRFTGGRTGLPRPRRRDRVHRPRRRPVRAVRQIDPAAGRPRLARADGCLRRALRAGIPLGEDRRADRGRVRQRAERKA